MIKLGLVGYPLGHSLSPRIHDAAIQACGLEGDYSPFPIRLDDKQELKDVLSCVRSGEILGLNVTIPHKQNVIEDLDELTPTAKAIGAVNTIYMRENKLVGDNTDAPGFLLDLYKFIGDKKSRAAGRPSSIVMGAGGSARAVVYALVHDGWDVTLAARHIEQAERLSTQFEHTDQSPLPAGAILSKDTFLYDLVYNPLETRLVTEARAQGLQATTGLGMLIEQAALAFELWTGYSASRQVMRSAVDHL